MIQDLGSLNGTYIIVNNLNLNIENNNNSVLLYLGETLVKVLASKNEIKNNIVISFHIIEGIA